MLLNIRRKAKLPSYVTNDYWLFSKLPGDKHGFYANDVQLFLVNYSVLFSTSFLNSGRNRFRRFDLQSIMFELSRSQQPCGLRRRSTAALLLRSWVRIPPGAWMFVCCECCVLSGRDLCDGLITRPEESDRL